MTALTLPGMSSLPACHAPVAIRNVRIAELLELLNRRSRSAALDFHAVALHERDVLVDGFVRDTERGDDVARHAAELFFALKNRGLNTGTTQEVRSCNTRRAAADDRGLFALDLCGNLDVSHQCAVALRGRNELGVSNLDGLVVEVARALVLAAVSADGAGDERQSVLFSDELEGGTIEALAAELDVFGDVLMDRAAALAGGREAVESKGLFPRTFSKRRA